MFNWKHGRKNFAHPDGRMEKTASAPWYAPRDLNNKSGGSGQALFMELQFEQVTAKVQIDAVKADNMTYK